MKLHKIQVGGLSFVEFSDFNAFNECKRLKTSLLFHHRLFGVRCTEIGADAIYGTKENRSVCQKLGITTNFVALGRKPSKEKSKDEASLKNRALRSEIAKERATRLEGSFGNEKNHYGLDKIKAKEAGTEQIWVLFGIMTTNVVKVASIQQEKQRKAQEEETTRRELARFKQAS
jgi:transposase, IS5 family